MHPRIGVVDTTYIDIWRARLRNRRQPQGRPRPKRRIQVRSQRRAPITVRPRSPTTGQFLTAYLITCLDATSVGSLFVLIIARAGSSSSSETSNYNTEKKHYAPLTTSPVPVSTDIVVNFWSAKLNINRKVGSLYGSACTRQKLLLLLSGQARLAPSLLPVAAINEDLTPTSRPPEWTPTSSGRPHIRPLRRVSTGPGPSHFSADTVASHIIQQQYSVLFSPATDQARLPGAPATIYSSIKTAIMVRHSARHRQQNRPRLNPLAIATVHGFLPSMCHLSLDCR